jgi:hypothetical protein
MSSIADRAAAPPTCPLLAGMRPRTPAGARRSRGESMQTKSTHIVRFRPFTVVLSLSALALFGAGCGDDDDPEQHEDPDVEACEHMQEGPPSAVMAAAAFSISAPAVRNDHQRYDLTLTDAAGSKSGFVTFAAAKAGEYIVYTSAPVKLSVKNAAMVEVAPESSATSIARCTEVKGKHVYDLAVGTYVIGVGPETSDKVSLVLEANEHAH